MGHHPLRARDQKREMRYIVEFNEVGEMIGGSEGKIIWQAKKLYQDTYEKENALYKCSNLYGMVILFSCSTYKFLRRSNAFILITNSC